VVAPRHFDIEAGGPARPSPSPSRLNAIGDHFAKTSEEHPLRATGVLETSVLVMWAAGTVSLDEQRAADLTLLY
jgi:hypothetical protein